MVLSELRSPVAHDIGGQIVGIVAPVALIGRSIFVVVLGSGRAQVACLHRRKAQLGGTYGLERYVSRYLEHVLDRSEFDSRRGNGIELVVLLISLVVMPCRVAGGGAGESGGTVFVQRNENRLRADFELALDNV